MHTDPVEQHAWLQRWVGQWTYESECVAEPGKEPMTFKGTEIIRPVGGLWIIAEGSGEMPGGGGDMTTVLTIGYDPKESRFVGSWVGSMMGHLWTYTGWLEGNELTLEAEGASFENPEQTTKYRDITKLVSDDERRFRSQMLDSTGQWQQMVSIVYRRTR